MSSFEGLVERIRRKNDKSLEKLVLSSEGRVPIEKLYPELEGLLEIQRIPVNGSYLLIIENKTEIQEGMPKRIEEPLVCNHGTMVDPVEGYFLNFLYKSQFFDKVMAPSRIKKGRINSIERLQEYACEIVWPYLRGREYYLWGHSQGAYTNVYMAKNIPGAKGMVNNSPPVETDKQYWEMIINILECGVNDLTRSKIKNIMYKGFHLKTFINGVMDFKGMLNLAREFANFSHKDAGTVEIPAQNNLTGSDEVYDNYEALIDSFDHIYVHPDSQTNLLKKMPHDWFIYNGNRQAETNMNINFYSGTDLPVNMVVPRMSLLGFLVSSQLKILIKAGYAVKAAYELGNDIANIRPDIALTQEDFEAKTPPRRPEISYTFSNYP